jgi:hypothetical protein
LGPEDVANKIAEVSDRGKHILMRSCDLLDPAIPEASYPSLFCYVSQRIFFLSFATKKILVDAAALL